MFHQICIWCPSGCKSPVEQYLLKSRVRYSFSFWKKSPAICVRFFDLFKKDLFIWVRETSFCVFPVLLLSILISIKKNIFKTLKSVNDDISNIRGMRAINTTTTHTNTMVAFKTKNKKHNRNGHPAFKSQRRYHSNQKLLHYYQHPKNQLNS